MLKNLLKNEEHSTFISRTPESYIIFLKKIRVKWVGEIFDSCAGNSSWKSGKNHKMRVAMNCRHHVLIEAYFFHNSKFFAKLMPFHFSLYPRNHRCKLWCPREAQFLIHPHKMEMVHPLWNRPDLKTVSHVHSLWYFYNV